MAWTSCCIAWHCNVRMGKVMDWTKLNPFWQVSRVSWLWGDVPFPSNIWTWLRSRRTCVRRWVVDSLYEGGLCFWCACRRHSDTYIVGYRGRSEVLSVALLSLYETNYLNVIAFVLCHLSHTYIASTCIVSFRFVWRRESWYMLEVVLEVPLYTPATIFSFLHLVN